MRIFSSLLNYSLFLSHLLVGSRLVGVSPRPESPVTPPPAREAPAPTPPPPVAPEYGWRRNVRPTPSRCQRCPRTPSPAAGTFHVVDLGSGTRVV